MSIVEFASFIWRKKGRLAHLHFPPKSTQLTQVNTSQTTPDRPPKNCTKAAPFSIYTKFSFYYQEPTPPATRSSLFPPTATVRRKDWETNHTWRKSTARPRLLLFMEILRNLPTTDRFTYIYLYLNFHMVNLLKPIEMKYIQVWLWKLTSCNEVLLMWNSLYRDANL